MGLGTMVLDAKRFLDKVFPVREETEVTKDPFLARALQINEEIQSGKNRPLSKNEARRFFDRIMRSKS